MFKALVTTLLISVLACFPAAAQLSQEYAQFFEGPEGHLLTKKEVKAWSKIDNDDDAEAFVELFWAKRDPDLESKINEFQLDFAARVKIADDAFAQEDERGALTDRGKILILFGIPARRSVEAPGMLAAPSGSGGATTNETNVEIWEYPAIQLPVKTRDDVLHVFFAESRIGRGDFLLNRAREWNTFVTSTVKKVAEELVVHPKLSKVPSFGLLPRTQVASSEQMQWLGGEGPWPEGAQAFTVEGLVSGSRHYIWSYLFLPAGTEAEVLVGRLVRQGSEGEEIGSFALNAAPTPVEGGVAYEFGLQVAPGDWQLELAAADASGPVAVTSLRTEIAELGLDSAAISPIYWGGPAQQDRDADLGSSYNVGGWHVAPSVKDEYATSDSISCLAYVLNPTVKEGSEQPVLKRALSVYSGDKRLSRQAPETVPVAQVNDGLWMFGTRFDLDIFHKSGEYVVKVELELPDDGIERVVEIPVRVAVEDGQEE
ncbi:MAG: GWxTD domain-containing protein [bacterium]|nr:GWxTD domain-containing protein [bacterium]